MIDLDPVKIEPESAINHISFIDLLESRKDVVKLRRPRGRFRTWMTFSRILWFVAVVVFFFGFWGIWIQNPKNNPDSPIGKFIIVIYQTLQLFIAVADPEKLSSAFSEPSCGSKVQFGCYGDNNIPLIIAFLMSPIITAAAGISALLKIFNEQWNLVKIRMQKDHIVILGLGDKGIQLVRDFREIGYLVVVIDPLENNKNKRSSEQLGALVLVGDATDPDMLMKAKVHHASHVIVATGKDKTNLKIATEIYKLVTETRGMKSATSSILGTSIFDNLRRIRKKFMELKFLSTSDVNCKVHLTNEGYFELIRDHSIFSETQDYFELGFFNTNRNAARILFFDNPLDELHDTDSEDGDPVHILIHGTNDVSDAVLLQAVKLAHFANGKRLQASIVGENIDELEYRINTRYPDLLDVVECSFVRDVRSMSIADDKMLLENGSRQVSAIIICIDDDRQGLKQSMYYRRLLEVGYHLRSVPIFVYLKDNFGLSTSYLEIEKDVMHPVIAFGGTSRVSNSEFVIQDKLDVLAKAIHNNYRKSNDAIPRWEELSFDLQDSNRQQADHILVKLRAIDSTVSLEEKGGTGSFAFTTKEIDKLARMEHRRWVAERRLSGWSDGEVVDREKKLTPYLVPYDELDEDVKERDRDTVKFIPKLLKMQEFGISRIAII